MKLLIVCLAALALFSAPAVACPPVDPGVDPNGSFSYGAGADMCEAPMIAGNFGMGAGYGGGVSFAAPSYSASFAAPVYSAPVVQRQVFAAPAYSAGFAAPVYPAAVYGRGAFARGFRSGAVIAAPAYGGFGGGFRGGYGSVGFAAPVVHTRAFAAPVYGSTVVAAPVVAVPVRAVGPIRGALQGFRAGLHNRLSGF